MLEPSHNDELPAIPGKRYFTIGEVSELCDVKPHVLRYWEQEFPQLTHHPTAPMNVTQLVIGVHAAETCCSLCSPLACKDALKCRLCK